MTTLLQSTVSQPQSLNNTPAAIMDSGDMDIDMDIDLGPLDIPETSDITDVPAQLNATGALPTQSTVTSGQIAVAHKVHITGVDDLTTSDLETFAAEHDSAEGLSRIEWVDDSSANMVYETSEAALDALRSLAHPFTGQEAASIPALQLRAAKSLSTWPESPLQVRIAVSTDVKRPRAYEASRFYMMHPEYDPRERLRGRKHTQGDSDYRKRRYGDGEHRRRRLHDTENGYSESMYDDDSGSLARMGQVSRRSSISMNSSISSLADRRTHQRKRSRTGQLEDCYRPGRGTQDDPHRRRSASPGTVHDACGAAEGRLARQRTPPPANRSKELFPIKSAGVTWRKELFPNKSIAANLKKELFPAKTSNSHHRRSDAFDAADETADLFATRMALSKRSPVTGRPTTITDLTFGRLRSSDPKPYDKPEVEDSGISIRGASRHQSSGVSIRGAAAASQAETNRELFPTKMGNLGKELFAEKLQGRGLRRNKAEDMFH
ncbi:MAG: hypothetical protein Q9223_000090 [Gallowayella weberi]